MKYILMPFILIYHVVCTICSYPSKMIDKLKNGKKSTKNNKGLEKVQDETLVVPQQGMVNSQNVNINTEIQPSPAIPINQAMTNTSLPNGQMPIGMNQNQVMNQQQPGIQNTKSQQNKKYGPKKSFRYIVINGMNKKEQGTFEAEREEEVRSFLISLDYKVLEIKERSKYDIDINIGNKVKAADLSFLLTQLSTYIKAGIPLVNSVKILAKQTSKKNLKKVFNQVVYELLRGESFSGALEAQGEVFPKLLINMVKTSELTGDLPSILDDMAEYYTSMDNTRKQMVGAMIYPCVVLTIAFGVLVFMIVYLVPQFSTMFEANDATLPTITLTVLAISDFVQKHGILVVVCIAVFVGIFMYLYKHVQKFREKVQIVLMHLPIFKNIIIYNEIANFTKTFASLINHGVFITDSMEILSKITNNEVYKRIINKTTTNLAKGDTISMAFKGEWAIPVVAYEMLVTGETTGQLGLMMEKVATHFQMLHKSVIDQMKSMIEPILICFLALVVGVILLSIIQPMFSIYNQVQ